MATHTMFREKWTEYMLALRFEQAVSSTPDPILFVRWCKKEKAALFVRQAPADRLQIRLVVGGAVGIERDQGFGLPTSF